MSSEVLDKPTLSTTRDHTKLPSYKRQLGVVAGLHVIALLLVALHIYVRTLPPTPEPIPTATLAQGAGGGVWGRVWAGLAVDGRWGGAGGGGWGGVGPGGWGRWGGAGG